MVTARGDSGDAHTTQGIHDARDAEARGRWHERAWLADELTLVLPTRRPAPVPKLLPVSLAVAVAVIVTVAVAVIVTVAVAAPAAACATAGAAERVRVDIGVASADARPSAAHEADACMDAWNLRV